MKAVALEGYGSPDRFRLTEVEKPTIEPDEVLVRMRATSINRADWEAMIGRFPRRGFRRPKHPIQGGDIAGIVEAVGAQVSRFRPGDQVVGDISWRNNGAFAEYVSAPERLLATKSPSMSFEQTAAVPQAFGLALQALRKGRLRSGQRLLMNGAGGGVGTFAIQLAKDMGAHVTAVDKASKLEALRSLGADAVVDHEQQDFTATRERYDLVVDPVASRSIRAYARALEPGGRCVVIGGTMSAIIRLGLLGPLVMTGGRRGGLLIHRPNPEDFIHMNRLFEAGKVAPVIDSVYPLKRFPDAMRHFVEGSFIGKIVIDVAGGSQS
jgi:NADPH:quinone reductase-like Zn-dependent oxidoreductase